MELVKEISNTQFSMFIPVVLSLVAIACVYVFGFKSAEQPAFDKLSIITTDDRKNNAKKKKDKKEKVSLI